VFVLLARLAGIVFVGAGLAGVLALIGAQESALYLGMIGVLIGGAFIGLTNTVSWLPRIRLMGRPRTPEYREEVLSLFGSSYGIAACVGLVGLGLVIGSAVPNATALLIAGFAGLAAILIVVWPRDIWRR
jgi:hypothetical protein